MTSPRIVAGRAMLMLMTSAPTRTSSLQPCDASVALQLTQGPRNSVGGADSINMVSHHVAYGVRRPLVLGVSSSRLGLFVGRAAKTIMRRSRLMPT
jgi:hypothetical protein